MPSVAAAVISDLKRARAHYENKFCPPIRSEDSCCCICYFLCCLPCALLTVCYAESQRPSYEENLALDALVGTLEKFKCYPYSSKIIEVKDVILAIDNALLSTKTIVKLRPALEIIRASVASTHSIKLDVQLYAPPVCSMAASARP